MSGGVETHCIDLAIETRIAENATHDLANRVGEYSAGSLWGVTFS